MGRILYGVMGDAGGHVARSRAIAQQLKDHEIVFVGGGRVAELAKAGFSVLATPVLGTVLEGNRVSIAATARNALSVLASRSAVIDRLSAAIREYDPHLIVTDYEYFLPIAARRLRRDCVSVDRQHAVSHCVYRAPPGSFVDRRLTLAIIRGMYSVAHHYIVSSFAPMTPADPRLTEVLPPVLREDVVRLRPRDGDHALVYFRGISLEWVRELLSGRSRRFVIYGFDVDREEGNLAFRGTSEDGFLADLADCDYAISNGGHNLISEALYYGKPVMCFPVAHFYEQLVNANLLEQAGYGSYHHAGAGAGAALDGFEKKLAMFRRNIAQRGSWDRHAIPARLRSMIESTSIGRAQTRP